MADTLAYFEVAGTVLDVHFRLEAARTDQQDIVRVHIENNLVDWHMAFLE